MKKICMCLVFVVAGLVSTDAQASIILSAGAVLGLDNSGDNILQYDSGTGAVVGTVSLAGDNYTGITTVGDDVFVINVRGDVFEVDKNSGARSFLFAANSNENMGHYGGNLIFNKFGDGAFTERTTAGAIVRSGNLDSGATGLEGDAAGNRIYAGQYSGATAGQIRVYDGTTLAYLSSINLGLPGSSISGSTYDSGADEFWVATGFGDDRIRKYASDGTLLADFNAGSDWINGITVVASESNVIPEPSTMVIWAFGLAVASTFSRRRSS